ncbi:MAG TPA: hypothetical protein VH478_26775 [Trebonia sp.]|nr:hypothetical protein [Trebonia sp.]
MIATRSRLGRPTRLSAALRLAGAAVAVTGLAVLAIAAPAGSARAAATSGYNQMTGSGSTPSQVTVPWQRGLLGADNKPLTAAQSAGDLSPNADRGSASPSSPLSFMYPDFKNLKVTVSQTQNIVHQGITVTWSGGKPTTSAVDVRANFLQIMECYGDASTGPSPEDCEYGTPQLLGGGDNPQIGTRGGTPCLFGSPSTASPPPGWDGSPSYQGCDPYEPGSDKPSHLAPCPAGQDCATEPFYVPFAPADHPDQPAYDPVTLTQYFSQYTSNEVQQGVTGQDGTGDVQFQALTSIQAQGLGCGGAEADGTTQGCWLVIVPRGEWEPNGYHVSVAGASHADEIQSSPLSAGNWAQRIQVHLGYAPDASFCANPPQETLTTGTQLIGRALQSWELALNQNSHCTVEYSYAANYEGSVTGEMDISGTPFGLGFTTIPIGSEGTETGSPPTPVANLVYAPVAVTTLGFAFNINDGTGYVTQPVKVTPLLMAKALTQAYRSDLPDYYPDINAVQYKGPQWSWNNPLNITYDPEFSKLNPSILPLQGTQTIAPITTLDQSAVNQQVWQWIQASRDASSWLQGGTVKGNAVTEDPDYRALDLGRGRPQNLFPKAYRGKLSLPVGGVNETKQTADILPGQPFFDSIATEVLAGTNPSVGSTWDPTIVNPGGQLGYWSKSLPETPGRTFISGLVDSPVVGDYGLVPASLCTGDGAGGAGAGCVTLTPASVSAALKSARPDSAGLLQVNPATVGAGAYPLVQIVYAAVLTNQGAAQLNQYADLIAYAAGQGQTAGSAPGDLPPGYLPMPASLQDQAKAVVARLRHLAGDTAPSSPPPSSPGGGQPSGSGAGQATPTPTGTVINEGGGAPSSAGPATPATTGLPDGASSQLIGIQPAAGSTPAQPVGSIRVALIVVVIAGLACAGAGLLLRSARLPRRRRRPTAGPGT